MINTAYRFNSDLRCGVAIEATRYGFAWFRVMKLKNCVKPINADDPNLILILEEQP
jgi:hypothetical protein